METIQKPFEELTKEEAIELARECKRGCTTKEEIKGALTAAGFHGDAAAIAITTHGPMAMSMVMVYGPKGEIISV